MPSSLPYIEALSELAKTGAPFVAVTMIEATGSTPQDAGARMLVDAEAGWFMGPLAEARSNFVQLSLHKRC